MVSRAAASLLIAAVLPVQAAAQPAGRSFRLHGLVEPVRSHPVVAPRLAGTPFQLIIVRLAKGGQRVKKGDLLIEFDRTSQIKAARDREYEYRDLLSQLEKKRAQQHIDRATRQADFAIAEAALRRAQLDLLGADLLPGVQQEKNQQTFEEAQAKVAQLKKTNALKDRAAAADLRMTEIQRDRAKNAWDHARRNAEKMRIMAPLDGLVVLKSIWKGDSMGEPQDGEEMWPGAAVLDVVGPSSMRVRVRVNQADLDGLRVGLPARVTLDAYPGKSYPAKLLQISPIAVTSQFSQKVRTFVALFGIEGSDAQLAPDLSAAVDVSLQ